MTLKNLTIKKKLYLSYALIIILLLTSISTSYFFIQKINNDYLEIVEQNGVINSQILELRKNEKDFTLRDSKDSNYFSTGNSKYLTEKASIHNQLLEEINSLKNKTIFVKDQEQLSNLTNIEKYLKEYNQYFLESVTLINEIGYSDYGLTGKFRSIIHDLEASINNLNDNELRAEMLMARRHEKDYFLRSDLKYIDSLSITLENIRGLINSKNISNAQKFQMLADVNIYEESINEIIQKSITLGLSDTDGIKGKYREAIHNLEPLLVEVNDFTNAQIDKEMGIVSFIIIVESLIVLAICIGSALLIIRSITNPLKKLTEASEKIANGTLI